MSTNTYNASTAVKTVFVRELREHLLKKSSLITLIIMAVAAVGGIFVADYMTSKSDNDTVKIAVVGEAPFADSLADATDEIKDAEGADAAAGALTVGDYVRGRRQGRSRCRHRRRRRRRSRPRHRRRQGGLVEAACRRRPILAGPNAAGVAAETK